MNPQITISTQAEAIIFLVIIAIGIIILIITSIRRNLKTANWIINKAARKNQKRREEQAAQNIKIEAEKAERLATEERRHQEILQAIRESGKVPKDFQK